MPLPEVLGLPGAPGCRLPSSFTAPAAHTGAGHTERSLWFCFPVRLQHLRGQHAAQGGHQVEAAAFLPSGGRHLVRGGRHLAQLGGRHLGWRQLRAKGRENGGECFEGAVAHKGAWNEAFWREMRAARQELRWGLIPETQDRTDNCRGSHCHSCQCRIRSAPLCPQTAFHGEHCPHCTWHPLTAPRPAQGHCTSLALLPTAARVLCFLLSPLPRPPKHSQAAAKTQLSPWLVETVPRAREHRPVLSGDLPDIPASRDPVPGLEVLLQRHLLRAPRTRPD